MKRFLKMVSLVGCVSVASLASAQEVNVYSARKEALIKPLLDKFTESTGISVNLVTGNADALITRLKSEGKYSPADILITTDVGRLYRAKEQGLTQKIETDALKTLIPQNYIDPQGQWIGFTLRARPLMVAPQRVDETQLTRMEDLADKQWRGRVCVRSSSNIYNQSMVAAMIEQQGEEKTQVWLNDFVKNFARTPKGGDRDQIKAVVAGQCDVAIANTYYLAGMASSDDKATRETASKVKVIWPNQQDRGTHVNISGAVISKYAPNVESAQKLISFMLQEDSQVWYAKTNHEYPLRKEVEQSKVLTSFGAFKAENIDLSRVGELNRQAVLMMDKAGWK
ncbi:Fe(3+) ABC transporter substrate-binding protein [Paraglaciecola sp. L1A13]|uniref:Fe(3+) ABC transporter substrate-binding protein n=1 Tax=Paraglaciecola sp. L1A13 TaxID=2686359 RepID=UPI00131C9A2A|nr:Fe(3+) ABC transporter substrate-binding protein [Paraglaciecola sp. L1A13]